MEGPIPLPQAVPARSGRSVTRQGQLPEGARTGPGSGTLTPVVQVSCRAMTKQGQDRQPSQAVLRLPAACPGSSIAAPHPLQRAPHLRPEGHRRGNRLPRAGGFTQRGHRDVPQPCAEHVQEMLWQMHGWLLPPCQDCFHTAAVSRLV